jgi:hypothetical protein
VLHSAREISNTARLKRELLLLIVIGLLIEGWLIALYLLTSLRRASSGASGGRASRRDAPGH